MAPTARKSGFWLTVAIIALFAAAKPILFDTMDPDSFWHLRVAAQLQQDGIRPLVDTISYESIKTPWTPYSWLAELGMKRLWDVGGYRAAIAATALMTGGLVLLMTLAALELCPANPIAVILALAAGTYLALPYLSFRPVTFAIDLLALIAWLMLRDRRLGSTRAVWLIPPLTVLMTNCHFFSVFVPLTAGAVLVGDWMERRSVRRDIALLCLTAAACAATPLLPGTIASLVHYQFADPIVKARLVDELAPIWAGSRGLIAVLVLLAWLSGLWRSGLRSGEIIWALGCFVLLLRMGRFAPVFAPLGVATGAAMLPQFSGQVLTRRWIQTALIVALIGGSVRLIYAFPNAGTPFSLWLNRNGPNTPGYPAAAADFVAQNIAPGRIINEFSWGGYLSWRLGSKYPVFSDGRTQLYSPDFWQRVYINDPPDSTRLTAADAVTAILPQDHSRLGGELIRLGWVEVFHDDRSQVLVPRGSVLAVGR